MVSEKEARVRYVYQAPQQRLWLENKVRLTVKIYTLEPSCNFSITSHQSNRQTNNLSANSLNESCIATTAQKQLKTDAYQSALKYEESLKYYV